MIARIRSDIMHYAHLLYKPKKADYALYWEKDCIVVTDMISEAPLSASAPHEICLEKMLVDMYCDKLISSAYSKSEYASSKQERKKNTMN